LARKTRMRAVTSGQREVTSRRSARPLQANPPTPGSHIRQQAPDQRSRDSEQSGSSVLSTFLKTPRLLSLAVAGLASAAAALLYRRSSQTTQQADDQPAPESAPDKADIAAAPHFKQRTGAPSVSAEGTDVDAAFTPADGPVRTRKKRSDAGVKRGPRPSKIRTAGPLSGQFARELKSTDTSVIALAVNADTSVQLQDDPSQVEAEGHPS
jgi:hypothetical protein